ncbi:SAM-dependent methyltransferase [Actinacidiphila bryophytorum]|uniref:Tuberculostearic acid methyltransferase UfaA1 n=1 Tax=Actinacidiphila bryophytorum TaxID=1436133 RepID=A0A9W4H4N7_9ACTN|nr:cyclopropane-fatty-acyl-phospholipid synthase family protein [Actinacidiphila bryophytorum]MBM9435793.1 class I SAM-dependent methyltransferase [Actinacidiphila bryophytorum]MBN6541636.1 class I SAM-dependent methyltransferase [Actinacidiphila bryophytorum]CAG7650205.1 Tuberculostearic acid methyltransferase UfaA1 [Actinacidiphila bryophytorum]
MNGLVQLPTAAVTGRRPAAPVDPGVWPDVARLPAASAVRTAVARRLVGRALAGLPLRVAAPDGRIAGRGGPVLYLHDPGAFHRRIGADGLIGFGESYMAGEWDADDLVAVLTVLAEHATVLVPLALQRLRGLWAHRRPLDQANTPQGARDNIHRHYDLSNDLFALFLDETMTYSSAVFRDLPAGADDLATAQRHKIDLLLDLAGVRHGTRLLEIGTGWGELALRAARRGAHVRTVTLSVEQRDLAAARIAAAGLSDRVEVELRDYREVQGSYDAVVSVEMIEAVGAEYWPVYFTTLARLLAPGGRIALQSITMAHDRMLATRRSQSWIGKYVFPGGIIPSATAVATTAESCGLRVRSDTGFGEHYAETLRLWRNRFAGRARSGDVAALGFDHVFSRMWEFYLAYCEAGFRARYLNVQQFLLTASGTAGGAR